MATSKTGGGARRRGGPRAPLAPLAQALVETQTQLDALGAHYALVGGLAVSARAEPRTTRDIDLAVAVRDDLEAEGLLRELRHAGYRLVSLIEQTRTSRLATARLRQGGSTGVIVDLLFASSGIEPEIVAAATQVEILPGLTIGVALVTHLLAMKLLARDDRTRPQDWDDLRALFRVASDRDLLETETALDLIQARGFARRRPLRTLWTKALREFKR